MIDLPSVTADPGKAVKVAAEQLSWTPTRRPTLLTGRRKSHIVLKLKQYKDSFLSKLRSAAWYSWVTKRAAVTSVAQNGLLFKGGTKRVMLQ